MSMDFIVFLVNWGSIAGKGTGLDLAIFGLKSAINGRLETLHLFGSKNISHDFSKSRNPRRFLPAQIQ